jgi:hypothetical protein
MASCRLRIIADSVVETIALGSSIGADEVLMRNYTLKSSAAAKLFEARIGIGASPRDASDYSGTGSSTIVAKDMQPLADGKDPTYTMSQEKESPATAAQAGHQPRDLGAVGAAERAESPAGGMEEDKDEAPTSPEREDDRATQEATEGPPPLTERGDVSPPSSGQEQAGNDRTTASEGAKILPARPSADALGDRDHADQADADHDEATDEGNKVDASVIGRGQQDKAPPRRRRRTTPLRGARRRRSSRALRVQGTVLPRRSRSTRPRRSASTVPTAVTGPPPRLLTAEAGDPEAAAVPSNSREQARAAAVADSAAASVPMDVPANAIGERACPRRGTLGQPIKLIAYAGCSHPARAEGDRRPCPAALVRRRQFSSDPARALGRSNRIEPGEGMTKSCLTPRGGWAEISAPAPGRRRPGVAARASPPHHRHCAAR